MPHAIKSGPLYIFVGVAECHMASPIAHELCQRLIRILVVMISTRDTLCDVCRKKILLYQIDGQYSLAINFQAVKMIHITQRREPPKQRIDIPNVLTETENVHITTFVCQTKQRL